MGALCAFSWLRDLAPFVLTAVEAGNENQAGGVQVKGWKCSPKCAQGGRRQLQASRLMSPFVQPQKPEQVCVPGSAGAVVEESMIRWLASTNGNT